MTGVALAVGTTAVGLGTSIAGASSAKKGANKAAAAQIAGNDKALSSLLEQLINSQNALQSGYNSNLPVQQGVLGSSLGYQQPYSDAGQTALASLMSQITAQPARAASGTTPEQAQQLNADLQQKTQQAQQAQQAADRIKAQLDSMPYSAATAPIITQLQQQYVSAQQQAQQAQQQAQQAQVAIQSITPYQAAQEAITPVDTPLNRQFNSADYANDPTTGSAYTPTYANDFTKSNQDISTQQIRDWLTANQGATDKQILDAMQQNGISAQQMSEATGTPIEQITARISAANKTFVPSQPPDLTKNFDLTGWLANQGKTEQDLTKNFDTQGYLQSIGKSQNDLTGNFDTAGFLAKGGKTEGDLFRNFTMQDYQADPGYQFRLDQGNKALNNSAAARGSLLSGATLKAIADYNSGAASQEYGAAQNRFSGNQALAQNAQNTAFNQFGQNRDNLTSNVNTNADLFNLNRNNLQGAALNAFNQFGQNRDNASNVYQNAYSRWNDQNNTIFNRLSQLSNAGQTAATNQGGYQQNYGQQAQQAQQNLSSGLSNLAQNYGTNQANILSNNGQVLANQATQVANANGGMYQGIGNAINSGVTNATGAYMDNQTNDLLKQYLLKRGAIK